MAALGLRPALLATGQRTEREVDVIAPLDTRHHVAKLVGDNVTVLDLIRQHFIWPLGKVIVLDLAYAEASCTVWQFTSEKLDPAYSAESYAAAATVPSILIGVLVQVPDEQSCAIHLAQHNAERL